MQIAVYLFVYVFVYVCMLSVSTELYLLQIVFGFVSAFV